ncbi:tetratricopeptide repeat protein [Burkholderia gladioli]|uniref:tetratricopeptide repeat protein n=1 Tax=Burkholderia gladioli TaxID=28095 RepID=UPI00163E6C86|nr:tetratricopeptide repeat protein [Burkholderia gladioli]
MENRQILELATTHHLAGRLAEARELYQRALTLEPGEANLMFRLGMLDLQSGAYDAALDWLDAALARAPGNARYHLARGHVFAAAQCFAEAIGAYRQALALDADSIDTHFALASALQSAGQAAPAIEAYTALLERDPARVDALNNLGNCHRQLGEHQAAQAAYLRALELQPGDADALTNLGTLALATGQLDESMALLEMARQVAPDSPVVLANLGVALHRHGEFARSAALLTRTLALDPVFPEAAYNLANALHALGRRREALDHYQRAIEQAPAHADAYNNLGVVYQEAGSLHDAADAFDTAIRLRPAFLAALNNLAVTMRMLGAMDEAEARLRDALAADPRHSASHNNLGNVLKDQGRLDEGIDCYRHALACDPANVVAHGNLLYALSFQAMHPEAILDEARRWSARHEAPLRAHREPHARPAEPSRRLRIGYVSPDFRNHCQALFTIPLLSHHDHARFEIVCYSSVTRPDALTRRIAGHADLWREVRQLDDERLARLIREDGIDILVDLSMHMADSRPLLFARKPAPVQIAWLAYPGTTGIEAIDYRLTDPWLDPAGADGWYSERSLRLPETFWCYDPLTDTPEVNALPALANGHPTFGCLNNPCKLGDASFRLWAEVMRGFDEARLILMAPEGSARRLLLDRLRGHGIDDERVAFTAFRPRAEYLRTYHEIDIGLDTLPYNGHTTSLDSYWMGVPVVTRITDTVVGRAGLSQAANLGLSEVVADSDARFVEIATGLARDLPRLAAMRAGLRARLAASPLMDGARFARHVEAAYRGAWQNWCAAA